MPRRAQQSADSDALLTSFPSQSTDVIRAMLLFELGHGARPSARPEPRGGLGRSPSNKKLYRAMLFTGPGWPLWCCVVFQYTALPVLDKLNPWPTSLKKNSFGLVQV